MKLATKPLGMLLESREGRKLARHSLTSPPGTDYNWLTGRSIVSVKLQFMRQCLIRRRTPETWKVSQFSFSFISINLYFSLLLHSDDELVYISDSNSIRAGARKNITKTSYKPRVWQTQQWRKNFTRISFFPLLLLSTFFRLIRRILSVSFLVKKQSDSRTLDSLQWMLAARCECQPIEEIWSTTSHWQLLPLFIFFRSSRPTVVIFTRGHTTAYSIQHTVWRRRTKESSNRLRKSTLQPRVVKRNALPKERQEKNP